MCHSHETIKRFSLIELLVVIGIIAILCSLLLPALKQARDTTNAIACTGNLKQAGVAMLNYASDNDDRIISSGFKFWTNVYGESTYTWVSVFPFLIGPYVNFPNFDPAHVGPETTYMKSTNHLMKCPGYAKNPQTMSSYGMNNRLGWADDGTYIVTSNLAYKLTVYGTPTTRFMFTDRDPLGVFAVGDWMVYGVTTYGPADTRHHKGANFLFLDGHADKLLFASIPGSGAANCATPSAGHPAPYPF